MLYKTYLQKCVNRFFFIVFVLSSWYSVKDMKTFLSYLKIFVITLIAGSLVGIIVNLLLMYAVDFIVGSPGATVNTIHFKGMLAWCGFSAAMAPLFLITHSIRYPGSVLSRVVSYGIFNVLAWFCIIPLCLGGMEPISFLPENQNRNLVSEGYFRPVGKDGIVYYSKINKTTGMGSGLYIDLTAENWAEDSVTFIQNEKVLSLDTPFFADVLMAQIFETSLFFQWLAKTIIVVRNTAIAALQSGVFAWLQFCSLGFALLSVISIRRFFKWRLLNFGFVVFTFFGLIVLNAVHFLGWNGNVCNVISVPYWLMNCGIGGVLLIIGIILGIVKPDPNKEAEE